MPVVLDDEMLIPPSLRRRQQYMEQDRIIELGDGASSSTIELPPHRPRSPIVFHQDRYMPGPPVSEIDVVREREYVIDPAGERRTPRYYRSERVYDRPRARSVDYESYTDSYDSSYDDTDSYYLEDGTTYNGHRGVLRKPEIDRNHGRHLAEGGLVAAGAYEAGRRHDNRYRYEISPERHSHVGRHVAEAGLAGAAVHRLRRRGSSSASSEDRYSHSSRGGHHGLRHAVELGVGAVGAEKLYERHRNNRDSRERLQGRHPEDQNRNIRHFAEAGLGIAAAGAAKELYDAHKRRNSSRSRSSSSSRSPSRDKPSHTGRHIAAGALGATAVGLAAHKYAQRRDSRGSYSSDDEQEHHHRGRKIAAGLGAATAAGLAAKHYHDRNRSRSRSSSRDTGYRNHHGIRDTAIGAADVAAVEMVARRQASRSRSRARSHSRPRRKARSPSSNGSHKMRNAALGAGAIGAAKWAAGHAERNRSRSRSRSRSRPGILRRSGSRSQSKHRSSSRGATLAKAAVATMAGALVEKKNRERDYPRRATSADGRREQRRRRPSHGGDPREKRVHYNQYGSPSSRDSDDYDRSSRKNSGRSVSSDETQASSKVPPMSRSRRKRGSGSSSGIIGKAFKAVIIGGTEEGGSGMKEHVKHAMAEEVAYRVGESIVGKLRSKV
jgi:hypothetical protein